MTVDIFGNLFVTGAVNGDVRLWSLEAKKQVASATNLHKTPVKCVKFTNDGLKIISASSDDNIKIIDMKTLKLSSEINILDRSEETKFTLSPDSKYLAFGGLGSNLYLYNMEDSEIEQNPDNTELVTGVSALDWDQNSLTRVATIDTTGVLSLL